MKTTLKGITILLAWVFFINGNGLIAQTLVKDIGEFAANSNPSYPVVVGNRLFFVADDGVHGTELWIQDASGPRLVKDIYTFCDVDGIASSDPRNLTAFGGMVYFTAKTSTTGRELWKSEGTNGTTKMVKDIAIGPTGSNPGHLTNLNGIVYFRVTNGSEGYELWKSNGTDIGTSQIKDIFSGPSDGLVDGPCKNTFLFAFGNKLYFNAQTAESGMELWKADGAGAVQVADLRSGLGSSNPSNFAKAGSSFFFTANDGTTGYELFKLANAGLAEDGGENRSEAVSDETGAQRETTALEFSVFPNPASDQLTIAFQEPKPVSVALMDVSGKSLLTRSFDGSGSSTTFDVGHLQTGVYFMQVITTAKALPLQRVIIQH